MFGVVGCVMERKALAAVHLVSESYNLCIFSLVSKCFMFNFFSQQMLVIQISVGYSAIKYTHLSLKEFFECRLLNKNRIVAKKKTVNFPAGILS